LFGGAGVSRMALVAAMCGHMLIAANAAIAAEAIGEVERMKSTSYGTPPGASRIAKQLKDPLVFKELLETLSFSALEASLLDGSVLTLGASAKVVLDEFVYDPSAAKSGAILDMVEGSLRFVTGNIPKDAFRITTPVCTIAIRGTNFKVRVRGNGDTLVAVDEGAVAVTVATTGEEVIVNAGESVEIRRSGSASAPVDTVDFTDDEVKLVGNQIVDFGWGEPTSDEAEGNGAIIFTPTKPKKKETDSGKDVGKGGGGGEGGY
jgi:hypothetical protein